MLSNGLFINKRRREQWKAIVDEDLSKETVEGTGYKSVRKKYCYGQNDVQESDFDTLTSINSMP